MVALEFVEAPEAIGFDGFVAAAIDRAIDVKAEEIADAAAVAAVFFAAMHRFAEHEGEWPDVDAVFVVDPFIIEGKHRFGVILDAHEGHVFGAAFVEDD